ncbi:hypothetical protein CEXT_369001 [Caerostris extrusa]|uniref:Uncharacterized protein n=1 Tax=Caerostris extrusa TaxID=172846 RepID=A0AAV4MLF2_CAEEX|nr:hypothetical protein CEXT_369001 [Caerostris extrusa]
MPTKHFWRWQKAWEVHPMQFHYEWERCLEAVVLCSDHPDAVYRELCVTTATGPHQKVATTSCNVSDTLLAVASKRKSQLSPFLRDNIRCRTRVWPESLLEDYIRQHDGLQSFHLDRISFPFASNTHISEY